MTEPICCRTCNHLRIDEHEVDGKTAYQFTCTVLADDMTWCDINDFFCSEHSDRETVKRIREGI